MDLFAKKEAALSHLNRCGSAVVALSGGVDSAVLLSLGFVFVVPADKQRSVVGLTFGVGADYEFYAPRPLLCVKE